METYPQAVLVTGVFGVGKSSVIAEIADALEVRDIQYAALDLDWLSWAWPGPDDDGLAEHRLMLEHLDLVVRNLRRRGNDRFLLAHAVPTTANWDDIRSTIAMPIRLVELRAPLELIRERAAPDPTTGRVDDLRRTTEWLAEDADGRSVRPTADLVVVNDRPIRDVAAGILDWLGW